MKNNELTPEQKARWEALAAMPDDEIDLTEMPEVTDWSGAIQGLFHLPADERRKAISELMALPDDQIDTTEIPEVLEWSNPKRGALYNPGERHVYVPMDTSERGFETLIYDALTGLPDVSDADAVRERPVSYGADWMPGEQTEYDRERCVDLIQLFAFLKTTQPEVADALSLDSNNNPARRQFLDRLSGEVSRRGVIDALRNGIKHLQHNITLFYPSPSANNETAAYLHRQNRFSVTRQLRYSNRSKNQSVDLALFVNGLPVATMELKNNLTGQTYKHAIEQYQNTRNPRQEPLFSPGRCAAHFALDESQVHFCAELKGKQSVFLPFNKGRDGGAGNPANPSGCRAAYFWEEILQPDNLTDIIENYACVVTEGGRGRKNAKKSIWPRYHQLDAVRRLLGDVRKNGVGRRYLIQHSAGSGKSNSIAWLARGLMSVEQDGKRLFDSIIVITDRRVLDRQIDDTIKQFMQIESNVGHADSARDLGWLLQEGTRIITTTVQKFPFIQDAIGAGHKDKNFAIIIDEAHSGQGGSTAIEMGRVLGNSAFSGEIEDYEDAINAAIESRQLLANASYFAFTATPKNKTLEMFGEPDAQSNGDVKHRPFHLYTMKQAIEECFIIDVLTHYTPYKSYYELNKAIQDDPEFDSRRAQRKLRRYVEEHPITVAQKAAIIVDHFDSAVFRPKKLSGKARAMVVAESVNRAIEYYYAIRERIREEGLGYGVLVAFSGERDFNGETVSEPMLNGFSESETAAKFRDGDYRILVCADKFQTGYDEPLLHTMYVDKTLSGLKAVQTLSRLNRAVSGKGETFILDFANDADEIERSFADYYRATMLSGETDANKLHDLKYRLDESGVYTQERVADVNSAFFFHNGDGLGNRSRGDKFEPALEDCVDRYLKLDEDGQVEFKGDAKSFTRTYAFLSQITDIRSKEWEELHTFLTFLTPKLPSPVEDDLSAGIEQAVDLESYHIEKQAMMKIILEDQDAEIEPVPIGMGGGLPALDLDPLSIIVDEFNKHHRPPGVSEEDMSNWIVTIVNKVKDDNKFQNARLHSDMENAEQEHSRAVSEAVTLGLSSNTALFGAYFDDEGNLRNRLNARLFRLNY